MPPFLALGGGEILKQFAGLLQLARISLIADFEDGIRQQLSTFRCCLNGCMGETANRQMQKRLLDPNGPRLFFGVLCKPFKRMAGTTRLELATSAVTVSGL
jgi:hypothetical protein